MATQRELVLRDRALAAVMGGLPTDFGAETEMASDMSIQFGRDAVSPFGAEFGDDDDDYGAEFGADTTAAVASVPAAAIPRPTPQAMQKLWVQHHAMKHAEAKRNMLLEPNKGMSTKIEKYGFSLNQNLTLGAGVAAINVTGAPDYNIRASRISMNAPSNAFATITDIKVANVSALSASGSADAFEFNPNAVRSELDLPTITPANKMSVLGSYTNLIPPGFAGGFVFPFIITAKGWATIVA